MVGELEPLRFRRRWLTAHFGRKTSQASVGSERSERTTTPTTSKLLDMKHKTRTIVSAVLLSQDQKILLGKIREGGVYPDCWHIPGGGIDEGESKHTALVREIKEETGIDILGIHPKILSDSDTGEAVKTDKNTGEKVLVTMHFNTYQIDLPNNSNEITISLNDDLQEYRWVPLGELKNYKHTPPSEKLFTSLGWI